MPTIDLTVSGGTPPYTFSWDTGETGEDIDNLMAGTYTVVVIDANGCTETGSYTVTEPTELHLEVTISPQDVCQELNEVCITVWGGTQPYTIYAAHGCDIFQIPDYLLVPTSASGDTVEICIPNVPPGMYLAAVLDANNCLAWEGFIVEFVMDLEVAIDQPTCGLNDGSVCIDVLGGQAPYSFTWQGINVLAGTGSGTGGSGSGSGNGTTCAGDFFLNNLAPGIYQFTVTDANGCLLTHTIVIEAEDGPSLLATIEGVSCHGENDGAIDLEVSGGTPPYTYVWNNGDTTEDIDNLAGGWYSVTVTDDNGCVAAAEYFVNEPDPLALDFVIAQPVCGGQSECVCLCVWRHFALYLVCF